MLYSPKYKERQVRKTDDYTFEKSTICQKKRKNNGIMRILRGDPIEGLDLWG